jgi:hypothetical protein
MRRGDIGGQPDARRGCPSVPEDDHRLTVATYVISAERASSQDRKPFATTCFPSCSLVAKKYKPLVWS